MLGFRGSLEIRTSNIQAVRNRAELGDMVKRPLWQKCVFGGVGLVLAFAPDFFSNNPWVVSGGVGLGSLVVIGAVAWGFFDYVIPGKTTNTTTQSASHEKLLSHLEQLEKDATPRLRIESLNGPAYRKMNVHRARREYVCGIAIRNLSTTQEIKGVNVRITRFDNGSLDIFDAPQTVNPKRLTINAGVSQPWEIARGSHVDLGEVVDLAFNIVYHGGPYRTPVTPINMTIEASGEGTAPVTRDFVLTSDEHCRPMLIPAGETEDTENSTDTESSLKMTIGEGGPYFKTKGGVYDILRTFNLKLENIDRSSPISDCSVHILSVTPQVDYDESPWLLKNEIGLAAGEYAFIPLVTYGEARDPNKYSCGDTFMTMGTEKGRPNLDAGTKYTITLRAVAPETAYCEFKCQVWVSEEGRLRIEELH